MNNDKLTITLADLATVIETIMNKFDDELNIEDFLDYCYNNPDCYIEIE